MSISLQQNILKANSPAFSGPEAGQVSSYLTSLSTGYLISSYLA